MLRVVVFGVLMMLCGPASAFAQAMAPSSSPSPLPAGTLPFGRVKFGPNGIDRSGIVWSQCRGAEGQPGRWIPVEGAEVMHPTYVIERIALPPTAPEFSRPGTFYECVGADGNPGTPDPAVPAASSLPVGTKLVWESGMTIHRQGDADKDGFEVTYSSSGRAFTDAVGPVVVSGDRITVFSRVYGLDTSRYSRKVSIFRPGSPRPAAPTSCTIVVHGPSGHERTVETLPKPCTDLTNEEQSRAVAEARATMNG